MTDYKKGLVSVLTPAYNSASYIHNLLESVLMQTYQQIEMIVIDDGSTDSTSAVVQSYVPQFEKRGYTLQCVTQPNGGQSAAIDRGLKLVKGEFLVWPDSDDFYSSTDSIAILVDRLSSLPDEFGMVRAQASHILEGDETRKVIRTLGVGLPEFDERGKLFRDCLLEKGGFYCAAGSYMLRTQYLCELTDMQIYVNKDAGQNWQIMLPMLYNYSLFTIQQPIYYITERNSSHSHSVKKSYSDRIERLNTYENTLLATLDRIKDMSDNERADLKNQVRLKYARTRYAYAYAAKSKRLVFKYYNELKALNGLTYRHVIKAVLSSLNCFPS